MRNVNADFAELAACFTGARSGEGAIVQPELLDRARLDYSVESLKTVDTYLACLHAQRPTELTPDWQTTALWGGAYVGEVIRRQAVCHHDWVDFDDFLAAHPELKVLLGEKKQLVTRALLTADGRSFTLPINKVLRLIQQGPAESVWAFALEEIGAE